MRILFIADVLPYPPNTGIKIRTYNLIRELHALGHDVDLVCFRHLSLVKTGSELAELKSCLSSICSSIHVFLPRGEESDFLKFALMAINFIQSAPFRSVRYWSGEAVACVRDLLEKHRYDVIHLDKVELYKFADLAPQVPAVCTNHNVESLLMKRRSEFEYGILRRIFAYSQYLKTQRYEREVLGKVSGYITCTDLDKSYFEKTLRIQNNQCTIDNGVDTSYYESCDSFGGDYILLIGAQCKDATANFDATHYFMREIWPRIVSLRPNTCLRIVGRDPDEGIVNYQRLDSRVTVVGFVVDEREELRGAGALVVPLRLGGGSRLKILTAMAMARPIVSTTIGAEGIACKSGENILIADDPEVFADEVVRLLDDSVMRKKVGTAARAFVQARYDWKSIGQRFATFLESVSVRRGGANQK